MSDISITRYQSTIVTQDKVKSVHKGHDEGQLSNSNSQDQHERETQLQDSAENKIEAPETKVDLAELDAAVIKLNDYVQHVQRDMIFDLDMESENPLVTVIDRKSKKIVREFGGSEIIELAKKLDTQEPLFLFSARV